MPPALHGFDSPNLTATAPLPTPRSACPDVFRGHRPSPTCLGSTWCERNPTWRGLCLPGAREAGLTSPRQPERCDPRVSGKSRPCRERAVAGRSATESRTLAPSRGVAGVGGARGRWRDLGRFSAASFPSLRSPPTDSPPDLSADRDRHHLALRRVSPRVRDPLPPRSMPRRLIHVPSSWPRAPSPRHPWGLEPV